MLFGAIADTEKVLSSANRQANSGKSEQHNVLPLHTANNARFPLLPVISESSKSSTQAIGGTTSTRQVCNSFICMFNLNVCKAAVIYLVRFYIVVVMHNDSSRV